MEATAVRMTSAVPSPSVSRRATTSFIAGRLTSTVPSSSARIARGRSSPFAKTSTRNPSGACTERRREAKRGRNMASHAEEKGQGVCRRKVASCERNAAVAAAEQGASSLPDLARTGRRRRRLLSRRGRRRSDRLRLPQRIPSPVRGVLVFFPAEVESGRFRDLILRVLVAGGRTFVVAAEGDAAAGSAVHVAHVLLSAREHGRTGLQNAGQLGRGGFHTMQKSVLIALSLMFLGACATMDDGDADVAAGTPYHDPHTVGIVIAANQGEIDQGNAAAARATNADVRAFAQMMVTDHTTALAAVRDTSARAGVKIGRAHV